MCSRTRTFSKMATKRRPPIRSRDGDDHQNGTQLKDDLSNARQTRSGRSPRPPPSPRHDHRRVDPMDCGSCPRDGHVDVENSDESDEDPLLTDSQEVGSPLTSRTTPYGRIYPDLEPTSRGSTSSSPRQNLLTPSPHHRHHSTPTSPRSPNGTYHLDVTGDASPIRVKDKRDHRLFPGRSQTTGTTEETGIKQRYRNETKAKREMDRTRDTDEQRHEQKERRLVASRVEVGGICIGVVFLVVVIGLVVFSSVKLYPKFFYPLAVDPLSPSHQFSSLFPSSVIRAFPTQPKRTWQFFQAPLRRVIREATTSSEPAVVLMAGDPPTVKCLARRTAALLHSISNSSLPNFATFRGSSVASGQPLEVKNQLETFLRSHFDGGGKVVVLDDADLIPSEATLLLHAFADHENAPYKDVFMFLTINNEVEIDSLDNMRKIQTQILKYFDDKLSRDLGKDATAALMSRIANDFVLVIEEKKMICDQS